MKETISLSIKELLDSYRKGEIRPLEVVRAYRERIEELEGRIGAFIYVSGDDVLKDAEKLDTVDPRSLPLYGVPVAVKDNICTRGCPTTAGSRILEGYRAPYTATAVKRLVEAGAVVMGKTNLDEFAMGSSTENSAFRATANPWNLDYAPGGSSGGSAAAVAAGMAPAALGSDTGGSIRQPASLCGVVGMKGTYGSVSRYGLIAFASSLDQIGPMARNVTDCALIFDVISGHDPNDSTSMIGYSADLSSSGGTGLRGLRIAVPRAVEGCEMSESVSDIFRKTVSTVEDEGAKVGIVDLPGLDASIACYYILANAEASSNLARYDGVRYGFRHDSDSLDGMYEKTRGEGFGEEVKRRILLGTYVLSAGYDAYYVKAKKLQAMLREAYGKVFHEYDLVMMPTSPTPAFKLGERLEDPISMYLSDIFTTPANIAGLPAISLPAGLSQERLPIGVQLVAGARMESKLINAAVGLERLFGFREKCLPAEGEVI